MEKVIFIFFLYLMWFLKKSVTFDEEELSDLLKSLNSIV